MSTRHVISTYIRVRLTQTFNRLTAPSGLSYRDRSSLLPSGHSSGRSSPYPHTNTPPQGQRFAEDLEGQNDERLEGLTAKVKLLKDVSLTKMQAANV
jgi:blocked-early-in-transport protein 1